MGTKTTLRPTDTKLTFTMSPDLDIMGFREISSEITVGHPLYTQFVEALVRINIPISNTGLNKMQKEELQKNVKEFYSSHAQEIEKHCEQTRKHWSNCKDQFLRACDELFSHKSFMEVTEFIAYPTLWKVYIQQIKQHSISFPLAVDAHDHDEAIYVVLHELLHAFFYQYAEVMPSLKNKDNLWDIAELFNSIVLNQPKFKKFYPAHMVTIYPVHEKVIEEIVASGNNDDADFIIAQIIKYLKS